MLLVHFFCFIYLYLSLSLPTSIHMGFITFISLWAFKVPLNLSHILARRKWIKSCRMPNCRGITITCSLGTFLASRNNDSLLTTKHNHIAMYREWTAAAAVNRCGVNALYQRRKASLLDVDTGFACLPRSLLFCPWTKLLTPCGPGGFVKWHLSSGLFYLNQSGLKK